MSMSNQIYYPQPKTFDMETLSRYTPLTPGRNTIRMLSDKYKDIKPGDVIKMTYQTKGDVYGREIVTVKSVHVSSLNSICLAHGKHNHGFHMQAPGVLRDFLLDCYGEDDCDTNLFIAIYV